MVYCYKDDSGDFYRCTTSPVLAYQWHVMDNREILDEETKELVDMEKLASDATKIAESLVASNNLSGTVSYDPE